MRALVLADGSSVGRTDLDTAWPGWDRDIALVIAADGGARLAAGLGVVVDAWVGDGDSLRELDRRDLLDRGVAVEPVSPDKDESDAELAILEAVRRGASDVTIIGALGGARLDHALANITLLAHPTLEGTGARLFSASARVTLLVGGSARSACVLTGRSGDLVTLLPLGGDAGGVTVSGLRFPLVGERLVGGSTRGLSNVRTAPECVVELDSGWLLVVETPATLPE